jgi:deazaflavin-dependent oxidoreductase (nitroreductase family)
VAIPAWKRFQELVYYSGEYLTIGLVVRWGPRGVARWFFRIPVGLYRAGLGWLVGHVVLVVTTRGRRTGRPHANATRYEQDPGTDTYFVLSGWEGRTDWYRNATRDPRVHLRVGSRSFWTIAEPLDADGAGRVLRMYLARNPFGARTIRRETGVAFDGSDERLREIASHYPAVALRGPQDRPVRDVPQM